MLDCLFYKHKNVGLVRAYWHAPDRSPYIPPPERWGNYGLLVKALSEFFPKEKPEEELLALFRIYTARYKKLISTAFVKTSLYE